MGVYVETEIRCSLDELWRRTQDPREHARWDLRFSEIEYLPRPDGEQLQQFVYRTRIGVLAIAGQGRTVGSRETAAGECVSALKFWSDDPRSLIREGAGHWKYFPGDGAVRFATRYDYRVRYGFAGRLLDRLVFRRWMAWATAWSFDRLRLWIEKGIDPASSLRLSAVHWLARVGVAFVWLYQGIVPKLFRPHADELVMLRDAGFSSETAGCLLHILGWAEIAIALAVLIARRPARLFAFTLVLMAAATAAVAIFSPSYLTAAFNPVSLNVAVAVLAGIGWLSSHDLPSAAHCRYSRSSKHAEESRPEVEQ
ncbi:MAG TPA: DoxX-like family protein [Pirellulales bacterium]|nr:DoxX-like family protein [Pirellulales bacterium]